MQSATPSRHVQVASRDWSWWGSADCQSLRSFSTSQDRASDGNNLCVVLTWTKFQLVTYSKKNLLFLWNLYCQGFLFKAWQSCCRYLFLHCRHSIDLPFLCVMQEGNKACKISGCALQDNITVSLWTGILKLEMIRDYTQFKSVKSLLVWKVLVFFRSLHLGKLVGIPDH